MKVWDRAGIELATPGSAVSHTSVTSHVTDCAMRPGIISYSCQMIDVTVLICFFCQIVDEVMIINFYDWL